MLFWLVSMGYVQTPSSPGSDPAPADPTTIPIDGGVIALVVAGGVYGVRKLMQQKED